MIRYAWEPAHQNNYHQSLEGAALRWRSDRDGDLGTGSQARVTLSLGQHVITLAATDTDGNHATASIEYPGARYRRFLS